MNPSDSRLRLLLDRACRAVPARARAEARVTFLPTKARPKTNLDSTSQLLRPHACQVASSSSCSA